ncbi:hypothetical protein ACFL2T_01220 [Elusimicrobiota bacterium]
MNTPRLTLSALCVALGIVGVMAGPSVGANLADLKSQLEGTDWGAKEKAIAILSKRAEADPMAKQVLTDRLRVEIDSAKEIARKDVFVEPPLKGQSECFSRLLSAVATLRDPAMASLLADSKEAHPAHPDVSQALLSFGEPSVGPLIQKASDERATTISRVNSFGLLGFIARNDRLDWKHREMACNAASRLARDRNDSVRSTAVSVLGHLGREEHLEILRDISDNDPYCEDAMVIAKNPSEPRQRRCPVRIEAQHAIDGIRKNLDRTGSSLYALQLQRFDEKPQWAVNFHASLTESQRGRLRDYLLSTKGQGVGGAWETKGNLPPSERLNEKGYVDWKFRIAKNLHKFERQFIEWFLFKFTNIEPINPVFDYQNSGQEQTP